MHWGAPDDSSLRYASDVVPTKPGTDVAVNGHVYNRRRAASVHAALTVGNVRKVVASTGVRRWGSSRMGPRCSAPEPFEKLALRFEHAFGGWFEDGKQHRIVHDENPVGVGFAREPGPEVRVPQLLDPEQDYISVSKRLRSMSLGFIPTAWRQRARFAGTFDDTWMETRRPLFPIDFDERFYNAVADDQVLLPKLEGGEILMLRNLHPRAEVVSLTLPSLRFEARFQVKERVCELPMVADTLLIEPDEERLSITFRAAITLDCDPRYVRSVFFKERS